MNRRNFIYNSALLAATAATGCKSAPQTSIDRGIQLYMVKEDMARDPAGTLGQLGKLGYTQIESYGSDKGIFWGYSAADFKKLANDNGLQLISTHHNPPKDLGEFDRMAAECTQIGMKYLICPWLGPQKTIEDFKRFADEFNQRGKICQKYGIRYGYHPHDYPYKKVDGKLPIRTLLRNTDPDLVFYQLDVYYAVTEGQDPFELLNRYRDRFKLMHMRDVLKQRLPAGSEEESACDLGEGEVDYAKLIKTALNTGTDYFFVEQSRFFNETPLQSAQKNAAYLKGLQLA
jgi:sugar phosphate isomerase/epimerase